MLVLLASIFVFILVVDSVGGEGASHLLVTSSWPFINFSISCSLSLLFVYSVHSVCVPIFYNKKIWNLLIGEDAVYVQPNLEKPNSMLIFNFYLFIFIILIFIYSISSYLILYPTPYAHF